MTSEDAAWVKKHESRYMVTASGRKLHYGLPSVLDIEIEDIAHHLSNICRYTGATSRFYSVAEHCYHGSFQVPRFLALPFLLHDGGEAYIPDFASPLKWYLSDISPDIVENLDNSILSTIFQRFDVDFALYKHPLVKQTDLRMLSTEWRDLMPSADPLIELPDPYSFSVRRPIDRDGDPHTTMRDLYLRRFHELIAT